MYYCIARREVSFLILTVRNTLNVRGHEHRLNYWQHVSAEIPGGGVTQRNSNKQVLC